MKKTLTLKNEISQLSLLPGFVEQVASELHLDKSLLMNLNLVVEEAIANIVMYAYEGKEDENIILTLEKRKDLLQITITDTGIPFDPTGKEAPDVSLVAEERPIGGLGIFLIKQMMDNVSYRRENGKNILTLQKHLSPLSKPGKDRCAINNQDNG